MCYIIIVNPNQITGFTPGLTSIWNACFVGGILAAVVATLLMAFIANKPFALAAGILYFKIKQLFSLISEDQYEQAMPIVEKQRKKVYILAGLSTLFTILTIVMAIINNT